jgi:hypothetical protein
MAEKSRTLMCTGKNGHYALEFEDENGSVHGKATGPAPFNKAGWVSVVAEAYGGNDDEVEMLLVEKVRAYESAP